MDKYPVRLIDQFVIVRCFYDFKVISCNVLNEDFKKQKTYTCNKQLVAIMTTKFYLNNVLANSVPFIMSCYSRFCSILFCYRFQKI